MLGALFVLSVGFVLALTLAPDGRALPPTSGSPDEQWHLLRQLSSPDWIWSTISGFGRSLQKLANVALYVPIGAIGFLIWGNLWKVFAFGATLSLTIEALQGLMGRSADLSDVVHNCSGVIAGVVIASLYLRAIAARRVKRPARTADNVT
jgi:glycopeptide antibiotics resistance protein